jgi:hypothetical protein
MSSGWRFFVPPREENDKPFAIPAEVNAIARPASISATNLKRSFPVLSIYELYLPCLPLLAIFAP